MSFLTLRWRRVRTRLPAPPATLVSFSHVQTAGFICAILAAYDLWNITETNPGRLIRARIPPGLRDPFERVRFLYFSLLKAVLQGIPRKLARFFGRWDLISCRVFRGLHAISLYTRPRNYFGGTGKCPLQNREHFSLFRKYRSGGIFQPVRRQSNPVLQRASCSAQSSGSARLTSC